MGKLFVLCAVVLIGIVLLARDNTPQKEPNAQQRKLAAEKLQDGDLVLLGSTEKQVVWCFKRNPHSEVEWFATCPEKGMGCGHGIVWANALRIIRPTSPDYCEFARMFLSQQ